MKACEADAAKLRGAVRQERVEWEKADAESRSTLHSLREEWRMLQDTNAQLHANVTRLTKALEVTTQPVPLAWIAFSSVNFVISAFIHLFLSMYIHMHIN